jgi:hypothetical protein
LFQPDGQSNPVDFNRDSLPSSRVSSQSCNSLTPKPTSRPPYRTTSTTTTTTTTTTPKQCSYEQGTFSGDGYAEMLDKLIGEIKTTRLQLTMSFSTRQNNGLLLWQGDRSGNDQWISAGIKDGYLEFETNFGRGRTLLLRSKKRVNNGNTHRIEYRQNKGTGSLFVDGREEFTDKITGDASFSVKREKLYLAGHPDDIYDVTGARYSEGFTGCITNFGVEHFRLPGESGVPQFGSSNIGFNTKGYVLSLVNMDCVKMCRV